MPKSLCGGGGESEFSDRLWARPHQTILNIFDLCFPFYWALGLSFIALPKTGPGCIIPRLRAEILLKGMQKHITIRRTSPI